MSRVKLSFPPGQSGYLFFTGWDTDLRYPHSHEDLELNIIESGEVVYLIDSKQYTLTAGSCLWLFPDQEHQIIQKSPELSMLVLVFRAASLQRMVTTGTTAPLVDRQHEQVMCRKLTTSGVKEVLRTARRLIEHDGFLEYREAGITWLLFSVWELFLEAEIIPGKDCHWAVEQALKLIEADLSLQIPEVCARLNVSRGYLSSLFHQEFGMTIPQYRNQRRVEDFLMLYEPQRTILDCALEAGFGSYAQFYRVFSRILGTSPQDHFREAVDSKLDHRRDV